MQLFWLEEEYLDKLLRWAKVGAIALCLLATVKHPAFFRPFYPQVSSCDWVGAKTKVT